MGSIAAAVGISRQSLHAEFGTKDDLGTALVERETSIFFDGIRALLAAHPGDLAGAVYEAGCYVLDVTRDNPLLQTILTRAPADGHDSLLPVITTRGEPLIERGVGLLGGWVAGQWPSLDPVDTQLMVESVVRLSLSHIVTSTKPTAAVARDLAVLACRCVGFPDPA